MLEPGSSAARRAWGRLARELQSGARQPIAGREGAVMPRDGEVPTPITSVAWERHARDGPLRLLGVVLDVEDAGESVALDELLLAPRGLAQSGGGMAVDVAQRA